MEEPIPPDTAPIVAVADAIRIAWHHKHAQTHRPWHEVQHGSKLVWLECAYAAVSTWTMHDPVLRRPSP